MNPFLCLKIVILFFFLFLFNFIPTKEVLKADNPHLEKISQQAVRKIIYQFYMKKILDKLDKERDIFLTTKNFKSEIAKIIVKYSMKYDISPFLIYNIIKTESNFNPYAVSSKNAKGLMQLKNIAVKDVSGKLKNEFEIFSINKNIELGIKYFAKMLKQANGNIPLALTFYNKGIGKVRKMLKTKGFYEVVDNVYVRKILKIKKGDKNELGQICNVKILAWK